MVRLKVAFASTIRLPFIYFNSSMVRLKAKVHELGRLEIYIFQFQYGTVERILGCTPTSTLYYFNSSMVRLKGKMDYRIWVGLMLFQFQYGTVERILKMVAPSHYKLFQFQYGTVERCKCLFLQRAVKSISIPVWYGWKSYWAKKISRCSLDFNSSMVRLKGLKETTNKEKPWNFNSSMVRLKVRKMLKIRTPEIISIPVWYGWKKFTRPARHLICYFNSSMVRLKDHLGGCLLVHVIYFNSSMVRLKEKGRIWHEEIQ